VRTLLLAAVFLFLACPAWAAANESSIAERLAAEIGTTLKGATVKIPDPNGLDITFGGQTRSVAIGSVRAACSKSKANCDAAIHDYAQRAASYMLETVPIMRDQLRAVVRSRSYMARINAQMGSSASFVSEPLLGDLVSVCYRDLPRGRRPIVTKDLTVLQLDQPTALSACKENSRHALAPLASQWKELPDQGIGIIQNGGDVTDYLLSPEDWRPLAERLGGLVVAVPSEDTVLYARGANATDVNALYVLAKHLHSKAAVPVSAQVFRWTDHGWEKVRR
jgi:hypothetical protein